MAAQITYREWLSDFEGIDPDRLPRWWDKDAAAWYYAEYLYWLGRIARGEY